MPPKRASRATTRATASKKEKEQEKVAKTTTKTTRARKPEKEASVESNKTRTTPKSRKSDHVATEEEETTPIAYVHVAPEPRTIQRPLTRGRPGRGVRKVAPSMANKKTLEALKKRMEDERRVQGQAVEREEDEAPRSPSPARQTAAVPGTAVKAPATVTRPQSALKVQSTPGAETSVLALQNFRRRPRQPSLLAMVQNQNVDVGNDSTDFTLGDFSDDDEFAPHDEGTPLQNAKPIREEEEELVEAEHSPREEQQLELEQTPPPPVQQDEDEQDDLYNATPQRPRQSRKRKSDALEESEVQVIRSPSSRSEEEFASHSEKELEAIPATAPSPRSEDEIASHSEDELASHSEDDLPASHSEDEFEAIPATAPSDPEDPPANTESQQRKLLSDTFADPLSSSPPQSPMSPTSPIQKPRQNAPVSPTTTRKSARSTTSKRQHKPLTTATLRALLPKRRKRGGPVEEGDFEIPSSSSSAEANTSSAFDETNRRGIRKKQGVQKNTTKQKTVAGHGALPTPVTTKKKPLPAKGKATYAKKGTRKENNNTPPVNISSGSSSLSELLSADETADTSISTIGAGKSKETDNELGDELRKAREKFADVDAWEMEFESASLGAGGDSSPWR